MRRLNAARYTVSISSVKILVNCKTGIKQRQVCVNLICENKQRRKNFGVKRLLFNRFYPSPKTNTNIYSLNGYYVVTMSKRQIYVTS